MRWPGRRAGAPVEWIVYPDEGHGWYWREDMIDFWNRGAKFLDAHIGPR